MREAIIVLSLFNIFLAFSKHFLIEVHDKKGKIKTSKNTATNTEYGADYGDNDDYEDIQEQDDTKIYYDTSSTEGKKNILKVNFNCPGQAPICSLRTAD